MFAAWALLVTESFHERFFLVADGCIALETVVFNLFAIGTDFCMALRTRKSAIDIDFPVAGLDQ